MAMTVVPNVYINALADTLISFYAALGINYLSGIDSKINSKIKSSLLAVLCFIIACILLWGIHFFIYTVTGGMDKTFKETFNRFTFQFFDVITLLFIGSAISFAWLKNLESRNRSILYQQLIQEKREAELKFLKAQINPHFIFNTLNAINFSIDKENLQARRLVSDFADLFRFQLYESDQGNILLERELEFIKKYIKINELRMSETYSVSLEVKGDVKNKFLPPLLLIPFIENSFKHASNSSNQKAIIEINLNVNELCLYLAVKNTKGTKLASIDKVGGVGLDNVKKRLEILFPKQHQIIIHDDDDIFEIKLEIPLRDEMLYH